MLFSEEFFRDFFGMRAAKKPKQLAPPTTVDVSRCSMKQKAEVEALLSGYKEITKNAPTGYRKDYFILLAKYPVVITIG